MENKKRYIILGIITVLLMVLIVFLVGRSFGFFKYTKKGDVTNVITISGIKVDIENPENDALNLENAYPMNDEEGLALTPFVFTMTNTSNKVLSYTLRVENDEDKQLSCALEDQTICPKLTTNYIKYSYKKNDGTYTTPQLLSTNDDIIANGTISSGETISSSIIIWIDREAGNEIMDHYFFGQLIITGEQVLTYTEELLNGADPVLTNNLVPVIIAENGAVTKASTSSEWYDYETKKWANAVVLKDTNVVYNDDETIPESNIESYFVWIPKYSYQLWDLGDYSSLTTIGSKEHAIPIKFGLSNTSDANIGECTTPMNEAGTQGLAGESGNCKVGDYMTHPAFVWDGTLKDGIVPDL